MKLSKNHKEVFVTAVMNDVPKIDYSTQFEALVKQDMKDAAFPELRRALEHKEIYAMLVGAGYYTVCAPIVRKGNLTIHPYEAGVANVSTYYGYKMSVVAASAAMNISEAAVDQYLRTRDLRAQVKAVIDGCTTRKQAAERLPEFIKYLPEEMAPSTMLPAIANLAAELAKAGWPKGGVAA